jgi:anti-sigma factor RsiW
VAALVSPRQEHFINLFIWIAEKTVTRQGYNSLHWSQSGLTCWVISDLNGSELQQFVQLVHSFDLRPSSF